MFLFLFQIILTNLETNKEYLFECNDWLSRDHGDSEILREFAPSKEEGTLKGFDLFSCSNYYYMRLRVVLPLF